MDNDIRCCHDQCSRLWRFADEKLCIEHYRQHMRKDAYENPWKKYGLPPPRPENGERALRRIFHILNGADWMNGDGGWICISRIKLHDDDRQYWKLSSCQTLPTEQVGDLIVYLCYSVPRNCLKCLVLLECYFNYARKPRFVFGAQKKRSKIETNWFGVQIEVLQAHVEIFLKSPIFRLIGDN